MAKFCTGRLARVATAFGLLLALTSCQLGSIAAFQQNKQTPVTSPQSGGVVAVSPSVAASLNWEGTTTVGNTVWTVTPIN